MDPRVGIGQRGERAAARHLSLRGWVIRAARWRGASGGEIDLVATRGRVLAICEVKVLRHRLRDGDRPVSATQRARIAAGAEAFLNAHPQYAEHDVHLDLLLVHPRGGPWRVTHLVRALEW
ncbi:MAG TPA: YraN family protein [Miltoncostaeaceae bacterium]|nr:YraN family protein [Miltoncostaeaceae bacterium]